jgi:MFS family permease
VTGRFHRPCSSTVSLIRVPGRVNGESPGPRGTRTPERQWLRRARIAVCCNFTIPGVTLATWTARIPAIKAQLHLSNGALSLGLLAVGIGAILAMQPVGRLIERHGSAVATLPSALLVTIAFTGPGFARNLWELIVLLLMVGAGTGLLDVAMNTQAVEVERAYRRPIMVSFHAMYSIGGLAGALYGSLLAAAHISPAQTFLVMGTLLALVAASAGRWLLPATAAKPGHRGDHHPAGGRVRWQGRIVFLGILGLFCMLDEGCAADWSSVYLRDSLHAAAWLAPFAYGTFSVTMAIGRLLGDRLVARAGRVMLVRCGAALAAAGLGACLLIGAPAAGIAGFGALGAGLASIIPQLLTTAGNWDPQRSGHLVAQVSTISYLGILAGPVVIGPIAGLTGLPAALALPVILAGLVALSAGAVRPRTAAQS